VTTKVVTLAPSILATDGESITYAMKRLRTAIRL
jgi:hypothetical protein